MTRVGPTLRSPLAAVVRAVVFAVRPLEQLYEFAGPKSSFPIPSVRGGACRNLREFNNKRLERQIDDELIINKQ